MSLTWQRNRRLSEFSTFGIGGPISLFAIILTPEKMMEAFAYAKMHRIPFFVLGKGSNCLFDDDGFDGIVLLNRIDFLEWEGTMVKVGAGTSFSLLGNKSASKGLKGLEFASGIPASVGGAVFMNAGANGKETCEPLKEVLYLDSDGKQRVFLKEDLTFGYRRSSFQAMRGSILSATFQLENNKDTRQRQLEIIEKRMKTQPLKARSAGCVFRNPEPTKSAGALIDQAGLKGFTVGNASVSEIHANFLINKGNATAREVRSLIKIIQATVYEKTNIHLEPEIRIVGFHGEV